MKLTEQHRKVLTELLGEEWHEYTVGFRTGGLSKCSCGRTGCSVLDFCQHERRAFTTDAEMQAVYRALFKKGMWDDFENSHYMEWDSMMPFNDLTRNIAQYTAYLFSLSSPAEIEDRMVMVAEWWEGRKG